jgi:hypothetical protein
MMNLEKLICPIPLILTIVHQSISIPLRFPGRPLIHFFQALHSSRQHLTWSTRSLERDVARIVPDCVPGRDNVYYTQIGGLMSLRCTDRVISTSTGRARRRDPRDDPRSQAQTFQYGFLTLACSLQLVARWVISMVGHLIRLMSLDGVKTPREHWPRRTLPRRTLRSLLCSFAITAIMASVGERRR